MYAVTNNKNKSFHIVTVVSLCVAIYMLFLFAIEPNFYTNTLHLFQQIVAAVLIGLIAFLGIAGFYWARDRASKRWLKTVGPLELFKVCNDVTVKMQLDISKILSADKNSDDVDESLVIGEKLECFAYSYGLVVIGMSRYDPEFLQSYGFIQFHTRVLNRLVNSAKEKYAAMNVDMELVETQLKKTKTKELQKVMRAIEYYKENSEAHGAEALNPLIELISEHTSLKDAAYRRKISKITDRALNNVDVLIQNYKQ